MYLLLLEFKNEAHIIETLRLPPYGCNALHSKSRSQVAIHFIRWIYWYLLYTKLVEVVTTITGEPSIYLLH